MTGNDRNGNEKIHSVLDKKSDLIKLVHPIIHA